MTAGSPTPPGWYPRVDRPGYQDYWDGARWAESLQPLPSPPAPPPAPMSAPFQPPQPGPPSQFGYPANYPQAFQGPPPTPAKKSRGAGMWIAIGLVGLLVVGCIAAIAGGDLSDETPERATSLGDLTETTSGGDTPPTDPTAPAPEQPAVDDSADKGTLENPYRFGEKHSRDAGFLGAAWTVSIDDVWEIPKDPFLDDGTDPRICLGIIVTVTLDSLDSEEIVSNPFSMPDINLIDLDGQKAEDGFLLCDTSKFEGTGVSQKFEVEVTEGGTATYVDPVLIESPEYRYVAVEETIYQR